MRDIYHHTDRIHLKYDLPAEFAEPVMCIEALHSRVAQQIVSIVAQRDITNSEPVKIVYIIKVTCQGTAVFDTEEYGRDTVTFIIAQLGIRRRNRDTIATTLCLGYYRVKQPVGFAIRLVGGCTLRYIGDHKNSIYPALSHLAGIYFNLVQKRLLVFFSKIGRIDPQLVVFYNIDLWIVEKHRRIAMRIYYVRRAVYPLGSTKYLRLIDQPTEDFSVRIIIVLAHCICPRQMLGMPLYSENRVIQALYRLAYSIVGKSHSSESVGNTLHRLVMYAIYRQSITTHNTIQ